MWFNNFDGDILSDKTKESWLNYKDTKDLKADINKPKYFSNNKWVEW